MHDRFSTTGSQLTGFVHDLTVARSQTGTALADAVTAKANAAKDADEDAPPHIPGTKPSDPAGAAAWDHAHSAMGTFDGRAHDVAEAIKKASDDDLKDSRWDKFKDWVHGFAGVLDFLCDLAGILAAIIMVICIFIPGPGWLVAIALGATLFALAGHGLLAATGNGSWLDVAFDAVALLTMGLGGKALKLAASGRSALLSQMATKASSEAFAASMTRGLFNGGRGMLGELHTLGRLLNPAAYVRAFGEGRAASQLWKLRELPDTSRLLRLVSSGDNNLAAHLKDLRLLTNELGREAVPATFRTGVYKAMAWNGASALTDLSETAMNPKLGPNLQAYDFGPHQWASQHLTFDIPVDDIVGAVR